jgi:hypothetical protein
VRVSRFFVSPDSAEGWKEGLASATHWRQGYSAHSLAYAWHPVDGFPPRVATAFATSELGALEFVAGIPEYKVALPGGRTASQTDLFVLARTAAAAKVAIAVEGKAEEAFGDGTVAEWRQDASDGKKRRLEHLLAVLDLPDGEAIASLRYQLFHRTASALMEAERLHAPHAVMVVHSFSPTRRWREDFDAFAAVFQAYVEGDGISSAGDRFGRMLYLGWVTDDHPEVTP